MSLENYAGFGVPVGYDEPQSPAAAPVAAPAAAPVAAPVAAPLSPTEIAPAPGTPAFEEYRRLYGENPTLIRQNGVLVAPTAPTAPTREQFSWGESRPVENAGVTTYADYDRAAYERALQAYQSDVAAYNQLLDQYRDYVESGQAAQDQRAYRAQQAAAYVPASGAPTGFLGALGYSELPAWGVPWSAGTPEQGDLANYYKYIHGLGAPETFMPSDRAVAELAPYLRKDTWMSGNELVDYYYLDEAAKRADMLAQNQRALELYGTMEGWDEIAKNMNVPVNDPEQRALNQVMMAPAFLARSLGLTPYEADKFLNQWFAAHPGKDGPNSRYYGKYQMMRGVYEPTAALAKAYGVDDDPQVASFLSQLNKAAAQIDKLEAKRNRAGRFKIGDLVKAVSFVMGPMLGGVGGWVSSVAGMIDPKLGMLVGLGNLGAGSGLFGEVARAAVAGGQPGLFDALTASPSAAAMDALGINYGGAGGAMDMGAGFGGRTLPALGLQGSGMLGSLGATWASLPGWQQQALLAGGKLGLLALGGGKVTPMQIAAAAASPIAEAISSGDIGLTDDPLRRLGGDGYMDLGSSADIAAASSGYFPAYNGPVLRMDSLAERFAPASNDVLGEWSRSVGAYNIDPDMLSAETGALDFNDIEGILLEQVEPYTGPFIDADSFPALDDAYWDEQSGDTQQGGGAEQEQAPEQKREEEKEAPLSKLPVKQILSVAKALLPLLAGSDEAQQAARGAERVLRREYANEAERQRAYAQYAADLIAFLPEAERLGLDPRELAGALGTARVDPTTGRVTFVMGENAQEAFNALMNAATAAIERVTGADIESLTSERFGQIVEQLREKRSEQLADLTRALYARGLLGLVTYQEAGENPFTGEMESWQLAEGQGANPYFAATFAGWERENQRLASRARDDIEGYLQNLLNHAGGLLGKASGMDESVLSAFGELGAQSDAEQHANSKRLRGLYSQLVGPGGAHLARLTGMLPGDKALPALTDVDKIEMERRRLLWELAQRALEEQGE